MKGMLMCSNCGDMIEANDAIMMEGKVFCSEECKTDSVTKS